MGSNPSLSAIPAYAVLAPSLLGRKVGFDQWHLFDGTLLHIHIALYRRGFLATMVKAQITLGGTEFYIRKNCHHQFRMSIGDGLPVRGAAVRELRSIFLASLEGLAGQDASQPKGRSCEVFAQSDK